ncbi:hypothetical protein WAS41_004483 [Salmonella enterica]
MSSMTILNFTEDALMNKVMKAVGWAGITTIVLDLALPFIGGKSFIGPGLIKSYPFIICWAVITVIYYAIYAKKKKIS